jgi:hypothetical protein
MVDSRRRRRDPRERCCIGGAAVVVALALLVTSCGEADPDAVAVGVSPVSSTAVDRDVSEPVPSGSTTSPSTAAPTPSTALPAPPPAPAATGIGEFLAPMGIDDRPQPWVGYDREDWPHWADTDGDGCDARQQALIAASITPPQVDYFRCTVVAGDWYSSYDGVSTDDPSSFDVDHLVPLRDAHWSGGWRWTVEQRRLFANDQTNLWPVSASSNRSKGSSTPNQWRPARTEVWCEYAIRWVQVKVSWGLTATTPERDALGSMLERCDGLPAPPVLR